MNDWKHDDYKRIERAILYLATHAQRQPPLEEVAREVHLSEFHFQRLFKRWAGVTPKRFLQILTIDRAKASLSQSRNVMQASWDAGLSGPGRLHDLFVSIEAVTPGEFKERGRELTIAYGFHATPFGRCLLGHTARGICHLSFLDDASDHSRALNELRSSWPNANIQDAPQKTARIVSNIFDPRKGSTAPLLVKGTNFQAKVWRALLDIPSGTTATYRDLARRVCTERAARAVGNALASNQIAYLIPCHRVVRQLGAIGNYRWGPQRKKLMLAWEAARAAVPEGEIAR